MQPYVLQLLHCLLTGFLCHPVCLFQYIPESFDHPIAQRQQILFHLRSTIISDIDLIQHIPQICDYIRGVDCIADLDFTFFLHRYCLFPGHPSDCLPALSADFAHHCLRFLQQRLIQHIRAQQNQLHQQIILHIFQIFVRVKTTYIFDLIRFLHHKGP